jgi:hypothetical protein
MESGFKLILALDACFQDGRVATPLTTPPANGAIGLPWDSLRRPQNWRHFPARSLKSQDLLISAMSFAGPSPQVDFQSPIRPKYWASVPARFGDGSTVRFALACRQWSVPWYCFTGQAPSYSTQSSAPPTGHGVSDEADVSGRRLTTGRPALGGDFGRPPVTDITSLVLQKGRP